jgi:hypothetical protein
MPRIGPGGMLPTYSLGSEVGNETDFIRRKALCFSALRMLEKAKLKPKLGGRRLGCEKLYFAVCLEN